jgi:acetoin utilization deacetylase AcuC-like enzyme
LIRVYYSPAYVGSGYAFDTTRKAQWVAESLSRSPIPEIHLAEPKPLAREQLAEVHHPDYIRAIETGVPRDLADSQGFSWDPGLWPMVLASNGGVVAAALSALARGAAGSLSSGLHHARHARGAGFCTFNGLVIAARAALAARAGSVLILDLDAHCGGGTASLIAGERRIRQIDISVNSYDCYTCTEQVTLEIVEHSADYLPTLRRKLDEADQRELEFDLCLYNAGMDLCEDCSLGGLAGITHKMLAERERIVFEWCAKRKLPIAFVLAGGYAGRRLDEPALVELHRLTLSCAAQTAV